MTREEADFLVRTAPKMVLVAALEGFIRRRDLEHVAKPELVRLAGVVLGGRDRDDFGNVLEEELRVQKARKQMTTQRKRT